jgi:hypothetical protein
MRRILCCVLGVMLVASVGCERRRRRPLGTVSGIGVGVGGMGVGNPDFCMTAPVISAPATLTNDLSGAMDNVNEMITMSGYAWRGRDHFYAIDMLAGQTIALTLNDQVDPTRNFDGGVYVFRNCMAVNATTVAGRDTSTGGTPVTFMAMVAGRYYIAVDAWIENTGGPYTLTVTPGVPGAMANPTPPSMPMPMPMPPPTVAPPAMGGVSPVMPMANNCVTAQPIAVGMTVSGDLRTGSAVSNDRIEATGYAWAGPEHYFALTLAAGQQVSITFNDLGRFDGGIYVATSCANITGSVVGGADTSATSPFRFTAPATARYIVVADAWIAGTGGAYTLSVTP